eukprot:Skav205328  [mRNA]  locus=scaffold3444:369257:370293:+ [translate_table: standard]
MYCRSEADQNGTVIQDLCSPVLDIVTTRNRWDAENAVKNVRTLDVPENSHVGHGRIPLFSLFTSVEHVESYFRFHLRYS